MKKCLILMFILGHLLVAWKMGYAQDIVISTFDYKSPNVDVAERVMAEAYKRIGLTMNICRLPALRSLQTANKGEVDGELIRKDEISQTYPNLIKVPITIMTIDFVVFAKEKRFHVNGWESLIPYNVGYRSGIPLIKNNLVKGTKSEEVSTLEQALEKLDLGRNDVVVDTRLGGLMKLKQLMMKNIVVLEPPLIASPQFHYLHVQNQRLLEPLTVALEQMVKEGVIQQIQQQVLEELSFLSK
ncbi:MAG: ABC transporter substrate-binding protein [Desulfobulbus sp.]